MDVLHAPALAYFQDEINVVDDSKILHIDPIPEVGYDYHEWSYSGLTVKAGSNLAAEHGLSALLHDMGFEWYAPFDETDSIIPPKRPGFINDNLLQVKTKYAILNSALIPSYGAAGWGADFLSERFQLLANYDKWAVLNCVHHNRMLFISGHRWQAVVMADSDYWDLHEDMLLPGDTPNSRRFDLAGMSPEKRTECVMACAAYLLDAGLNDENRTHFDPTDGNPHNSTQVCDFTKEVCIQMREGTDAIGKYNAQVGVPDAILNILAYSNHGTPPSEIYTSHIHVQITVGYQYGGFTTEELIATWAPKVESLSLYFYWDLPAWYDCMPISSRATKSGYFDVEISSLLAANIKGVITESSGNWFNCIVSYHQYISYARTGSYNYSQALDQVIADVFNNDSAVLSLYNLWGDNSTFLHPWSLAESFGYVNEMEPGWYKTAFMELHVIYDEYRELLNLPIIHPTSLWINSGSGIRTPIQNTNDPSYDAATDPLPAKFKQLMGHCHAIRLDQHFHSWGMQSRMANGGTMLTHYPDLYLSRRILPIGSPPYTTDPDWMYAPFAVRPSPGEFDARKAALDSLTIRPEAVLMDSEDLVLVTGITPEYNCGNIDTGCAESKYIRLQHESQNTWAKIKFVALAGGGSVTVSRTDLTHAVTTNYEEGLHNLHAGKDAIIRATNGYLFLAGFPPVATENDSGVPPELTDGVNTPQHYWLYIPETSAGHTYVSTNGAFAARNQTSVFTVLNKNSGSGPWDWGSGHIAIMRQGSRGQHILHRGINNWFSLSSTVALMPRVMAREANFGPEVRIVEVSPRALLPCPSWMPGWLCRLWRNIWRRYQRFFNNDVKP